MYLTRPTHLVYNGYMKTEVKDVQEKYTSYTFKAPSDLLARVKDKAGLIPVSAIIRRLLEKWLAGEVNLD